MLSSVLDVIDLECRNQGDEIRVGGFDLIHAGGSTLPSVNRAGDGSSSYTTAIGAEIPRQKVDRMPRGPETSLPPAGAGGRNSGDGNSRRQSSSSSGGSGHAQGSSSGDPVGVGGSGCASPARASVRGGGASVSGGSCGTVSGLARSHSSSMPRAMRTGSTDCLSRDSRNDGQVGRNEAATRGSSRGVERNAGGSGGNGTIGVVGGSRANFKAKIVRNRDREHRDRAERSGGGKERANSRDRKRADKRGVTSPPSRTVNITTAVTPPLSKEGPPL